MALPKGFIFAVVVVGFVVVANVQCAPESIEPENILTRVRRQMPEIPSMPPGIPSIPGIPGASGIKNAGSGFAKNVPGLGSLPGGLSRLTRSISETAAAEMDEMMMRTKREARGTGNLPTKTG